MSVRDFPPRPQGATPDSVPYQNWLDALGQRQNIDLLQELTSVASGDEIAIFDASETGNNKTKKATVANLAAAIGGGVSGPGSSTDNAVARWDGTDGDTLQDSAFIVDNSGHVTSFGGQIAFPATQSASSDANTLDDYEEGTFTPTVVSTGGGAPTYSTQYGSYTKIGDRVFVTVRVVLATLGTLGAGGVEVAGLPFTVANVTGNIPTWSFSGTGFRAAVNSMQAFSINNTTNIRPTRLTSGTQSQIQVSELTGTSVFNLTGFYLAA